MPVLNEVADLRVGSTAASAAYLGGAKVWPSAATFTGGFESIATYTVSTSGIKSITFSSIPATYQHLQIRGIMRSTRSAESVTFKMTVNGDASAVYANHDLSGNGSGASASGSASMTETYLRRFAGSPATANTFGAVVLDILDYADTSKNTTFRHFGGYDNNGSGEVGVYSGLWANTAAVSSITIGPDSQNYDLATHTTLALYGIRP